MFPLLAPLVIAGCLLMLLATAALIWRQARPDNAPARLWYALAPPGLIAIGAVLWLRGFGEAGLGLNLGVMLVLVLWTADLLLLLASLRRPVATLGLLLFPLTALALPLLLLPPASDVLVAGGAGLRVHILTSVLAYGLFVLACVQAVLLAIQDRHLKRHEPGRLLRSLPPLTEMERWLFQLLAFGFIALSASLGTGLIFVDDLLAQHLAHKVVFSIAAWIVFAVLLWGRWRYGWRGQRAVRVTLAGGLLLLLAYFGAKWVLEIILNTSWDGA